MNIAGGAYCFHSQIIRRCLAGGAVQCFILLRSTGSTLERLCSGFLHLLPFLSHRFSLSLSFALSSNSYRYQFQRRFPCPFPSPPLCDRAVIAGRNFPKRPYVNRIARSTKNNPTFHQTLFLKFCSSLVYFHHLQIPCVRDRRVISRDTMQRISFGKFARKFTGKEVKLARKEIARWWKYILRFFTREAKRWSGKKT